MANVKFYTTGKQEYITVTKEPLLSQKLSIEAKGALAYFQAVDNTNEINMTNFQNDNNIGRDKARRILRELEGAGYLSRESSQDDNGVFIWTWEFLL